MSDGPSTPVMVRLSPEMLEALDAYRHSLSNLPTRSEAIRRLIAKALKAQGDASS